MFSFLRRPALLALAAGLLVSACGGKAEFDVKGTITGLQYDGMVLTNNGGNDLNVPAKATSFVFPGAIAYGTPYSVDFKKQPLHTECKRSNFADSAGRQASIVVEINCFLVQHAIGGTVTGLTAAGLELNNGSDDRVAVASAATSYAFPSKVEFGKSYSITILKQPAGLVCSLVNQVGVIGDIDVTTANVNCVPAT